MKFHQLLLWPLSLLYGWVTDFRNILYDRKLRGSVKFDLPVITVGNLEVGGTGKTPMIDFLIRKLKSERSIAVLSRGYLRKSKGFRILNSEDTAETAGDEPYQLHLRHTTSIKVAVSAQRETAIPFILAEAPETNLILLDDAYQYRTVIPSLSVLLTRYSRPFTQDLPLPAGRLRENRHHARRADLIVVTKCPPSLPASAKAKTREEIAQYSKAPVFFTTLKYGVPQRLSGTLEKPEKVILVSGIANSGDLAEHVKATYKMINHYDFPDHYRYMSKDFRRINEKYGKELETGHLSVLVTEKDAAKWTSVQRLTQWKKWNVFMLPVECSFLEDEDTFLEMVRNSVKVYPTEE